MTDGISGGATVDMDGVTDVMIGVTDATTAAMIAATDEMEDTIVAELTRTPLPVTFADGAELIANTSA